MKTMGAKRYCVRDSETGELKITVAGVPKIGAECLEDDINNFTPNFVFSGSVTGKLTHEYINVEDIYIDDPQQLTEVLSEGGLFLALDTIRDPGNLGTILRIADWFGVDAVLAAKDTVDVFNPKVVQATMGAVFRVKMHYVDLPSVSEIILDKGGKVYGTFLDGRNMYSTSLDTIS